MEWTSTLSTVAQISLFIPPTRLNGFFGEELIEMVKMNAWYFTLSRAFQDGERFWRALCVRAGRLPQVSSSLNLPTVQNRLPVVWQHPPADCRSVPLRSRWRGIKYSAAFDVRAHICAALTPYVAEVNTTATPPTVCERTQSK